MTQTPLEINKTKNSRKAVLAAIVAGIYATNGINLTHDYNAGHNKETDKANSAHIKRYTFAYDNTKSDLTEASPKKEEPFVVDKKRFVFEQKDVTNSGDVKEKHISSFSKPSRFSENKEMFRQVKVSDFTEVEHVVYKESNSEKRQFSFRKPIKFQENNSDFYEVSHYEPIEYAQEKDDWI